MIPPFDSPVRRAWPPRQGAMFFGLWMAAEIVRLLLAWGRPAPRSEFTEVAHAGVALGTVGWQAWLLFGLQRQWLGCEAWLFARFQWRWLAWSILVLQSNQNNPVWPSTFLMIGHTTLVSLFPILLQSALFIGMRQRGWVWFGVWGMIYLWGLYAAKITLFWIVGLTAQICRWLPKTWVFDIWHWADFWWVLLPKIYAAAALAWLMPPVVAAVDEPGDLAAKREA